ncbi:MAG: hypothetical protein ILO68_01715, partial [Clostridia bacterium]|nr:hypothetical protein [Clostridia bacterium]
TLVVASYSKFVKKGTRNVSYAAFDQNNNVGTYTRTLTYSDYRAPRFVMHRPLHFHQNDSHDNVTLATMIQADDVLDGDISPQIIVTSGDRYMFSEDTERMPISVQVSNRAGDTASLDLEVSYLSYTAFNRQSPNLRDYILYTTVGSTPDYRGNILGVRSGTNTAELGDTRFDLYADFEIDTSEADIHTPGAYVVRYHLTSDEAGERQLLGSAEMILVVEEE